MQRLNQSGSHLVVMAVGLVVVGVIAAAGYTVANNSATSDTADSSLTSATSVKAVPATIKTKADLHKAASSLEASSADINSSVNGDSLNNDLSDLQ